jgi:hypothetical protein
MKFGVDDRHGRFDPARAREPSHHIIVALAASRPPSCFAGGEESLARGQAPR